MRRRTFFQSAALATLSAAAIRADDKSAAREFYELRAYTLKDEAQRKLVDEYLEKAFIPAMNRFGANPIGVFADPRPNTPLYVLAAFPSLDGWLKAADGLMSDAEHNKAGAALLTADKANPPYERIESSLLQAFEGWPKLIPPPQTKDKKPRIFQLRTYESPSEATGKKKIEMFHKGEMDAFKRAGCNPVFFSECLIGTKRPNLTYMLAFDDEPAQKKAWGAFVKDPDFHKMISMPEYSDKSIIRAINNSILTPTVYSQL
ncbi:MAG TPA: NIPSNAP family protein [Planctomycetota bacterium]|nr:NIPSNAP family protein [Planctomycetota bacterium]